ncbi:hypothetical protein [Bradyrhizobium sp. SZCCHNRI1003]|uniref:hypothetical protein n=1 Tax=Bradyrhizobium sp. SZCCHNRI1003 TaxID=3057275 RepID=UPI00291705DB|nr:hypothetical protein [Bradyrhizobium sp. SZCCHNRI1003]
MAGRKPLELPPEVAKAFLTDMEAFYAAPDWLAKDEIAARQLRVLREYLRPSDRKLGLTEVKELFAQMRDQVPGRKSRSSQG